MIFIARCVHGLEWVCADEIASTLPATDLALCRREVTFSLPSLDPGRPALGTVDDVFRRVGSVENVGATKDAVPALAKRLAELDWSGVRAGARFDVVASLEGRRTYNRSAVEAAAGATLAPVLRGTFLDRTAARDTDLTVRLFLRGSSVIAALRLGTRPLHRRAYKQDTGPGTLHPPVAAALARIARPEPGDVVLDPFCGDGTVAIETALAYPQARVVATDLDPARLANAAANARRAGVELSLAVADAGRGAAGTADVVLTNPPWNLAVDAAGSLAGSLDRFWTALLAGGGRLCAVTDAGLDVPATLDRRGFVAGLATQVRLAGRVSHLLLYGPPGNPAPALPESLASWRAQAIANGVVTERGF